MAGDNAAGPGVRATQKDVARAAGVSQATVSLALKNHPSIPAKTRQRIQAVAKDLGYRPDPLLASLIAYRSSKAIKRYTATIAWLQLRAASDQRGQECFPGASERCEKLGYRLEKFLLSAPGMTAERLSDILEARNIRGLLVAPLPVSRGHLRMRWENFAAVSFSYTLARPALHMVGNHHFRSMLLAMRKLRSRGYRRIGLALPASHDTRVDHNYSAGYWVEQCRLNRGDRIPPLVIPTLDKVAFSAWYNKHRPDALITAGYLQVGDWLSDLGARIPETVGVAQISRLRESSEYAGVDENSSLIGAAAVDFLAGMLNRHEYGIPAHQQRILIEGTWVEGPSIRSRNRHE